MSVRAWQKRIERLNVTLYSLQPSQKITELKHDNKIYHVYVDKPTSQAEKNPQSPKVEIANKTLGRLKE